MDDQQKYMKIAKSDIYAAKTLLENRCFPQAIFFTQQAVEKLSKYLALETDFFEPFEVTKQFGHKSLNVYQGVLTKQIDKLESYINSLTPEIPDEEAKKAVDFLGYNSDLINGLNLIRKIKDYDLMNISEEDLDGLIQQLNDANNSKIELPKSIQSLFEDDFDVVVDWLEKAGLLDEGSTEIIKNALEDDAMKEIIVKGYANLMTNLPVYLSAVLSVFHLSVVFTMHAVSARYHDPESDFDPLTFYTEDNPLVARLDIFQNYVVTAIFKLEEFEKSKNII